MDLLLLLTAKYLYVAVVLVAAVYWLSRPRKERIELVIFACVAAIVTFIFVKLGASLYFDPRPFTTHAVAAIYPHAPDNGFPSDHTALTAVIAIVIYNSSKKLGLVLGVLSLLVGVSRVLGNIHSPIDIVGSLVFALIGGVVASYITPVIYRRFAKEKKN